MEKGYKITVFKVGEESQGIPSTEDAVYFKDKTIEWYTGDEIKGKCLNIFIYKPVSKEDVLKMKPEEVLEIIANIFKGLADIYEWCRYKK